MLDSNGRLVKPNNSYHMTVEELKVLLGHLQRRSSMQYYCMVLTQFCLGLRASELCAINLLDFSENFTRLTYRAAKSNEVRYNEPVPTPLADLLRRYVFVNKHRLVDGWLWPSCQNPKNKHVTPASYQSALSKWRKQIGVKTSSFLDCYTHKVWRACSCGATKKGGWNAWQKQKCKENAMRCYKCDRDIRTGFQTRYRIGTHSLRRLHRTVLKNNVEDLYLVKELCGYKDWGSFQRYINAQEVHERKASIVNNVFGGLFCEVTLGSSAQSRLSHFD